jgi:hypothetical protein
MIFIAKNREEKGIPQERRMSYRDNKKNKSNLSLNLVLARDFKQMDSPNL